MRNCGMTATTRGRSGRSRFFILALIIVTSFSVGAAHARPATRDTVPGSWSPATARQRLARVVELIEESNAPRLIGWDTWRSLLEAHRARIESASSHRLFAEHLNELIKATGQSHFQYLTDDDWSYWHILSTFGSSGSDVAVDHAGLFTEEIEGRTFVRGILEGSPADGADIRVGDEVISADGEAFGPIASFRGKAGKTVILRIRRHANDVRDVAIVPVHESLHHAVQRAIRESIRVVNYRDHHFAYIHAWSFMGSGSEFHVLLDLQNEVDGLLWDLRDGFGGIAGRGTHFLLGNDSADAPWYKPTVVLIDDGTRSAKEILVDSIKSAGRAALVGMPTPGHVTSVGGFRRVGKDGLLMLPGHRFRLEGHPVTPHVQIDRPIPYSAGEDPQLEMGKLVLAKLIESYGALPASVH